MNLCENCIHVDVCNKETNEICENFKDKHCFVQLPCQIGTKVYVIESCQCYSKNYADRCANKLPDNRNRAIFTVSIKPKHKPESTFKCLKLFERPFKLEYVNKIGKTVFLSFKEAKNEISKKGDL